MTESSAYHTPVLVREVHDALCKNKNGIYIDATLGGGGHFRAMARSLESGATLIGIDRDPDAVTWNRDHAIESNATIIIENARFSEVGQLCAKYSIVSIDGALLDLGVSSFQIDRADRGFSFMQECGLDMRMNAREGERAGDLIGRLSVDELADVLASYGEIRNAPRMASTIKNGISGSATSFDLRECLAREYGDHLKFKILAKVFMALRIAVNNELDELRHFLESMPALLSEGGRLAVISYHSLEDRIVKDFFRNNEPHCICPKAALRCTCGNPGRLKRITRKPITATEQEVAANPRSRSARLRIVEKLPGESL
jgi:16S rRNA (cytosine1402-N4)-methyltransferase